MFLKILAVFLGGGIGSLFRYAIGLSFESQQNVFPIHTFAANTISCLLLGIFLGYVAIKPGISTTWYLFFAVGLCGGFSTFSTFMVDFIQLAEKGNSFIGFSYLLSSVVLGIGLIFLSRWLVVTFFS